MQLAISTATAACSVALLDGGCIIAERHEVVGRGHAERLVPMIESLPARGRANMIFVDCGPGSFTGIRVGLAAARALALAWKVQVQGFSALALIAAGASEEIDSIGVALQGGHGELFVQEFGLSPLIAKTGVASLRPDEAGVFLKSTAIIGSGAAAVRLARGHGTASDAYPRAANIRKLSPSLCALPPRAIYVRAPDAVLL